MALTAPPNPKAVASSKKTESKTTTPSEDTAGNPPVNTGGGTSNSLTGLPIGTPVQRGTEPRYTTGAGVSDVPAFVKAQYTKDAPFTVVANMSNQEKADLLLRLASIPNVYPPGMAPTVEFIQRQGVGITFRPTDYDALTKLMIHADYSGQSYNQSLSDFVTDPGLADKYFGKVSEVPKKIALTPQAALVDDINARFMDLFETGADTKMAAAYAKEYNKAELAAGGAGLTQTQRENIFQKYVEATALGRFKTVKGTADTADDMKLELGVLGQTIRQIRGAYSDNGIPVSEKQIYQDALAGMKSSVALSNKMESINLHAATQMPALKDWIAKGNTAKQFLSPYITSYSKIYGVPENQVTVDKFYEAFQGQVPLSVSQWEAEQWKKPDIKNTKYYQDTRKNDLRAMADAFGVNV
jgi:hypothetical protein